MGNPFQPLSIALWSIGSIAVLGYHVSLGSLEMGTPCTQALSWTKVDPRIEWSLFDEHIWNVWNILNYVYYVIPQRIEKIRNVYQYILMNIGKIPFSSFFGVITHIFTQVRNSFAQLRIHIFAPVANLLSLNEDLKTADMAQARSVLLGLQLML